MSGSSTPQRPARHQRHLTVRDGRVNSRALLDENGLLWIQHQGGLYQLRRTAAGKLILTK
ncbi:hemin uptake protein HemP [Alcanivorax quisquiliarum]|uniref:Hemin uptake protein HemP n=1 Tax=Alcanivorax quisquiliarum TaxID=2933565 RepID=A0ABT0E5L1_9GAMM|nr:hemin uptake protein HemP [Alcanivorax quisquiliarum]MCK0537099.1 hemin uptake protein HemP [Alcanivorax quisquiliarum]